MGRCHLNSFDISGMKDTGMEAHIKCLVLLGGLIGYSVWMAAVSTAVKSLLFNTGEQTTRDPSLFITFLVRQTTNFSLTALDVVFFHTLNVRNVITFEWGVWWGLGGSGKMK